ncbi:hypothetical protein TcCL_NonESM12535, partial [Trypanosoma cruzi]
MTARPSPALVDGEQPSRSSWCEFMSQITAAGPRRRMVLRQSSSKGNPGERRALRYELPGNYKAILIGAAALTDTTAAGDADGVTAMKRLCCSVSRAAGKPPRRSTTNRAWHLLEGWRRRGLHHARSNALP